MQAMASFDPARSSSGAVRGLFAMRRKAGALLGFDRPAAGLGTRVPTLHDRLPEDLRDAPSGPSSDRLPFTPLYLTEDEWALEIANRTVHGILHLGWVDDVGGIEGRAGRYRGQMAVLVKRNGLPGSV